MKTIHNMEVVFMEDYNKQKIINAVDAVYRDTDKTGLYTSEVKFRYVKSEAFKIVNDEIVISRTFTPSDFTYKLYTEPYGTFPLVTVFGGLPRNYVSDVFIRALEHLYDDHSTLRFCDENESGWVRF